MRLQIRYICECVCVIVHICVVVQAYCALLPKIPIIPMIINCVFVFMWTCVFAQVLILMDIECDPVLPDRPMTPPAPASLAQRVVRWLGEEPWQGHRIQPPLIWGQGQCLNTCPRLSGARGGLVIPCKVSLLGSADWTRLVYSRTNRTHVNSVKSRAPVRLSSRPTSSHSCWLGEFWVRVQN